MKTKQEVEQYFSEHTIAMEDYDFIIDVLYNIGYGMCWDFGRKTVTAEEFMQWFNQQKQ